MSYYEGLVVGGPLAGQRLKSDKNLYYHKLEGEPVTKADGSLAAYQPHLSFRYIFVSRYWFPYQGTSIVSLSEILDVLDEAYVAAMKEKS